MTRYFAQLALMCTCLFASLARCETSEGLRGYGARGIDTPQCKEAVSRIVASTNASFERSSSDGNTVFFRHPYAKELSISCRPEMRLGVFASWGDAFPPNLYFTLLAVSGSIITKEKGLILRDAAMRCHRVALKDKNETSQIDLKHAEIDCQSFTRDGGATAITISVGRED